MNNKLREPGGALIGGLVVLDYLDGIRDFNESNPPPDMTSPSYDLGRQRAAEKFEENDFAARYIKAKEDRVDKAMKDALPAEIYAEYRAKIDAINRRTSRT